MFLQRLAVLIGGFAAGALIRRGPSTGTLGASQSSVDKLSREWKEQAQAHDQRLSRLEERAEAHEAKLNEMPSTVQMVAAMDELLAQAMSGLEGRLTAQAQSIETLQATVTQTDELLERVLESLDMLRTTPN
jgi:uncharacterized coiled-coil protein SlyX